MSNPYFSASTYTVVTNTLISYTARNTLHSGIETAFDSVYAALQSPSDFVNGTKGDGYVVVYNLAGDELQYQSGASLSFTGTYTGETRLSAGDSLDYFENKIGTGFSIVGGLLEYTDSSLSTRVTDVENIVATVENNLSIESFYRMIGDDTSGIDPFQDGWSVIMNYASKSAAEADSIDAATSTDYVYDFTLDKAKLYAEVDKEIATGGTLVGGLTSAIVIQSMHVPGTLYGLMLYREITTSTTHNLYVVSYGITKNTDLTSEVTFGTPVLIATKGNLTDEYAYSSISLVDISAIGTTDLIKFCVTYTQTTTGPVYVTYLQAYTVDVSTLSTPSASGSALDLGVVNTASTIPVNVYLADNVVHVYFKNKSDSNYWSVVRYNGTALSAIVQLTASASAYFSAVRIDATTVGCVLGGSGSDCLFTCTDGSPIVSNYTSKFDLQCAVILSEHFLCPISSSKLGLLSYNGVNSKCILSTIIRSGNTLEPTYGSADVYTAGGTIITEMTTPVFGNMCLASATDQTINLIYYLTGSPVYHKYKLADLSSNTVSPTVGSAITLKQQAGLTSSITSTATGDNSFFWTTHSVADMIGWWTGNFNNLTNELAFADYTVLVAPEESKVLIWIEHFDDTTYTLGTDIEIFMSRNGNSEWVEATPEIALSFSDTSYIIEATADLSGGTSDTATKCKIVADQNVFVSVKAACNLLR